MSQGECSIVRCHMILIITFRVAIKPVAMYATGAVFTASPQLLPSMYWCEEMLDDDADYGTYCKQQHGRPALAGGKQASDIQLHSHQW